ncbi:MAG: tryptophan synthase subunit alpha [Oscillospiraceae bacterium]|jgi:tryptophan synthase alpha chain|nr:tryptophan synthase subunit alpha [Oscillospiraceae bacterium]
MSRIAKAFDHGKAFIGFVTGGDPTLDKSEEFILEMLRAGADLVEIGIPFSDPIAEGPTIQAANIRALANGATVDGCFELARRVRAKTDVPLVFLTYLNPVFRRGYDKFFADCKNSGVDGVIIPDMPFEEQGEAKPIAAKYDVDVISLIAPTSEARIAEIASQAAGFIYVVSSMGVTGVRSEITTDLNAIITQIRKVSEVPAAIGFGISTAQQAREMSKYADGVIVGSAIVKLCEKYGADAGSKIYEYVKTMKEAAAGS